jgi:hypothetical protein
MLAFAAIFEAALYITKETPAIYDHAPWLNDPYDTAVSFALFCVPLIGVPSALRLFASRGRQQSRRRLSDLIRACGVALAIIAVTLAACWAAVAQGANRSAWTSVTAIQVIGLVLLSAGAGAGAAALRASAAALRRDGEAATTSATGAPGAPAGAPSTREPDPDWLGDLIDAGQLVAGRFGPARRPLARLLDWAGHQIVPVIRRHPVGAAAVLSAAVGMLVAISQSVNEGYGVGLAGTFFGITTSGVFAFVVVAGWYLRVVRSDRPAERAPVLRAIVLAAAAVPVALAFRAALWSFVGLQPRDGGLPALALLVGAAAVLVFTASLTASRVARALHRAHPAR